MASVWTFAQIALGLKPYTGQWVSAVLYRSVWGVALGVGSTFEVEVKPRRVLWDEHKLMSLTYAMHITDRLGLHLSSH